MKRYNRNRRDNNEKPLLAVSERFGAKWWEDGPLDGWTLQRGVWTPTEIKDPVREGLADEYTPQQLRFFRWCSENRAPWFTWRTDADVMRDLGARVVA